VDQQGTVAAWALTGEDGCYDFRDLTPGVYTLTASGYAPVAARVELTGDHGGRRDVILGSGDGVPSSTPTTTGVRQEG
jgi:hypothetical protein